MLGKLNIFSPKIQKTFRGKFPKNNTCAKECNCPAKCWQRAYLFVGCAAKRERAVYESHCRCHGRVVSWTGPPLAQPKIPPAHALVNQTRCVNCSCIKCRLFKKRTRYVLSAVVFQGFLPFHIVLEILHA